LDLKPKRKESFNLFLEKVVTVLQKDVDPNQIVDVRGLSKVMTTNHFIWYHPYRNNHYFVFSPLTSQVEARIVVLSVLRKIKEQYLLGNV
jgi:hypothetical protein